MKAHQKKAPSTVTSAKAAQPGTVYLWEEGRRGGGRGSDVGVREEAMMEAAGVGQARHGGQRGRARRSPGSSRAGLAAAATAAAAAKRLGARSSESAPVEELERRGRVAGDLQGQRLREGKACGWGCSAAAAGSGGASGSGAARLGRARRPRPQPAAAPPPLPGRRTLGSPMNRYPTNGPTWKREGSGKTGGRERRRRVRSLSRAPVHRQLSSASAHPWQRSPGPPVHASRCRCRAPATAHARTMRATFCVMRYRPSATWRRAALVVCVM